MDFSIITPVYMGTETLVRAAQCMLAQSHEAWEWLVISDDQVDYAALLAQQGIVDARIRHLSTGQRGSGSSLARNVGLDAAQNRYVGFLDADDVTRTDKLARFSQYLGPYPIVSCALDVMSADLAPLRTVGEGPNGPLLTRDYKRVNLSGDSMIIYDRQRGDPRFNPDFPCLTDIEFLLQLFSWHEACFHLGEALHSYVKLPQSISNGPETSARMAATKRRLLAGLNEGTYPMADPEGQAGMISFFKASLEAETGYEAALADNPNLLFEDHLEPFLNRETG